MVAARVGGPRWLITQARFQEALKVLKWAAKVNRNTLPSDEVILDAMTYIEKLTLLERSKEEMEAPKEISCLRSEEEKEEEPKERSCQRSEEEGELKETSYQRSEEEEPKERSCQKIEDEGDELKERSCQRCEELNEEERKESCESWAMKVVRHFSILLLNPHLRLRTLVIFFGFFSASMVYYGVSLSATNLGTDPHLYVFLGGLLEVPSYLLLWPIMVFVGRRRSLALLFFTCAVCIFSVMALMLIQLNELVVVVLSLAGKVAITAACQLIWAYTSELYPTKVRSLALGEANFLARLGSLCSPYINDLLGEVVVWGPSALFGLVSLVAAALALILPETRHSDLQEALKH
ncbi:hypothetical protein Pcinc_009803 [Petrolisthes cinctipes]|uniref:Major facilitator superfamily (MFS) profile domain-containing protein n=1 Tax=Petrolisthes cinctipes TaxID=88211 RepID=A0AAE1KW35_PETCI|nr:hypothetical protein Pcinc_009803 [Petrolisthes cinctipes]